jgi:hypothetical protein
LPKGSSNHPGGSFQAPGTYVVCVTLDKGASWQEQGASVDVVGMQWNGSSASRAVTACFPVGFF